MYHCDVDAGRILLARDLITEDSNSNELVSPNLPHRGHSIADSHYVLTADCLAGFRLLRAGRFGGGGQPGDICFASFPLRGAARIRPRIRCSIPQTLKAAVSLRSCLRLTSCWCFLICCRHFQWMGGACCEPCLPHD